VVLVICLALAGLASASCDRAAARTHTIGVVNYDSILSPAYDGFKAKMAALGYVEGQTVTYVYHGLLKPDPQVLEREVKDLLAQRVQLLLTLGTLPTLTAKKATEGTAVPVVFAPVLNPVERNIVQSITHPGGNVTGVQNGDTVPKALEWLHRIVPRATKIYAIYNPKDTVSQTGIRSLSTVAASLGFELALIEVQGPEEALAVIEKLPKGTTMFFVPTPSLRPVGRLVEAAARRGIATAANVPETDFLVTYAADWFAIGGQAARLADQILKGTKPADLPVETPEFFLHINLKAATAIGLVVPDDILRQAHLVIR
jgi:putative ABC transport system substrate-binding protein